MKNFKKFRLGRTCLENPMPGQRMSQSQRQERQERQNQEKQLPIPV